MVRRRPKSIFLDDTAFEIKDQKRVPFDFVLDALEGQEPYTKPMFGCTAVYVGEKIVFVLRDKKGGADNGVWVATTRERHDALRAVLPNMQSISVLGAGVTSWQLLAFDAPDFEESVLRACALVVSGDPRIGNIPKPRRPAQKATKKGAPKRASKRKPAG